MRLIEGEGRQNFQIIRSARSGRLPNVSVPVRERLARSRCLPSLIYFLLGAEQASGSFMHLLRSELAAGLRCVSPLAMAAPSPRVSVTIGLQKTYNGDNGQTLL